jgi:hypothetical protein
MMGLWAFAACSDNEVMSGLLVPAAGSVAPPPAVTLVPRHAHVPVPGYAAELPEVSLVEAPEREDWTRAWRWDNAPVGAGFRSVWGVDPSEVWALAANGALVKWVNGQVEVSHPFDGRRFHLLWGSSVDEVWAAGQSGIGHWDGTRWSFWQSPVGTIHALHGASRDDVWLAGEEGIVRFDGDVWRRLPPVTSLRRVIVAALGGGRAFVGASGDDVAPECFIFGASWRSIGCGTTQSVDSATGSGPSDIWIVGDRDKPQGRLAHFDGHTWTASMNWYPSGSGFTSFGGSDIWLGALHFDGKAWGRVTGWHDLHLLGGTSSRDLFAYRKGWLVRWDGQGWRDLHQASIGDWTLGLQSDRPWLLTPNGEIRVRASDGSWAPHGVPAPLPVKGVAGPGGSSPNDVWAPLDDWKTWRWDGTRWLPMSSKPLKFVGGNGKETWFENTYSWSVKFVQYDGSQFIEHHGELFEEDRLSHRLAITQSGRVLAPGWRSHGSLARAAVLWEFDGRNWKRVWTSSRESELRRVFVSDTREIWGSMFVNGRYETVRWNGSDFETTGFPHDGVLLGTHGSDTWFLSHAGTLAAGLWRFDGSQWHPHPLPENILSGFVIDDLELFATSGQGAFYSRPFRK